MRVILMLYVVVMIAPISGVHANSFYENRERGWFFFEDLLKKKEEEDTKKEAPPETALFPPSDLSPVERMKDMKRRLKEVKYRAIIEPTVENQLAYKRFEQKIMQQSELFAHAGQKALLADPHLDERVGNPTAQIARPIAMSIEADKRTAKLKGLSSRYGLFFYFSSDCQYCHLFAPIVKMFQQRYGWDVMAISVDGKGIKEFPDYRVDNGSAVEHKIEAFPALMLFDAKTNSLRPFQYGFTTLDALEEQVTLIDTV